MTTCKINWNSINSGDPRLVRGAIHTFLCGSETFGSKVIPWIVEIMIPKIRRASKNRPLRPTANQVNCKGRCRAEFEVNKGQIVSQTTPDKKYVDYTSVGEAHVTIRGPFFFDFAFPALSDHIWRPKSAATHIFAEIGKTSLKATCRPPFGTILLNGLPVDTVITTVDFVGGKDTNRGRMIQRVKDSGAGSRWKILRNDATDFQEVTVISICRQFWRRQANVSQDLFGLYDSGELNIGEGHSESGGVRD
ncbi:hypothetical protein DFH09DRAFT_1100185 [Mycena vulgaris]|nr:hypothetical protein DFH09DRAFT_1100185 [Mycena vulgaris]